jgi:hypothetical protein
LDEGSGGAASSVHEFRITLGGGFRDHTVVVGVDGHQVYRRSSVYTDLTTPESIDVVAAFRVAHVVVSVNPGDLVASFDLDVSAHRNVVVSLIGEGTLSIETFS